MNTATKIKLQILVTHLEVLATHALDTDGPDYKGFCEAAEDLKAALDNDETILELR